MCAFCRSGGIWIIGYKAWGLLLARILACHGILVVLPDYRNFPQGAVQETVGGNDSFNFFVLMQCAHSTRCLTQAASAISWTT